MLVALGLALEEGVDPQLEAVEDLGEEEPPVEAASLSEVGVVHQLVEHQVAHLVLPFLLSFHLTLP